MNNLIEQRNILKPVDYSTMNDDKICIYKPSSEATHFTRSKKDGTRTIHIDPDVLHKLASLGLNRDMIAAYYGLSKKKLNQICEDYPAVNESIMMGTAQGIASAAAALEKKVESGDIIATLFRLKVGGFIEADKKKEQFEDLTPRVNIFLPNNNRG